MPDTTRFDGLFDIRDRLITIVGAGGIGSFAALALAKMGADLRVYEPQKVDSENSGTQLYGLAHVGWYKIDALEAILDDLANPRSLEAAVERVTPETLLIGSHVIVSAVDSIASRKAIWEAVKQVGRTPIYIDARMAAENVVLHTVNMQDFDWYDYLLRNQSDEEIPDLPCTMKATVYCGLIAGGLIGKTVRQIFSGMEAPRILDYNIVRDELVKI